MRLLCPLLTTACVLAAPIPTPAAEVTARWNPRTANSNVNPHPAIGDWGFDRPGHLDGTVSQAWLPGICEDAALQTVRGGPVLHVTRFTARNDDRVKAFANQRLLNPQAYPAAPALHIRPRTTLITARPSSNSSPAWVRPPWPRPSSKPRTRSPA